MSRMCAVPLSYCVPLLTPAPVKATEIVLPGETLLKLQNYHRNGYIKRSETYNGFHWLQNSSEHNNPKTLKPIRDETFGIYDAHDNEKQVTIPAQFSAGGN